MKLRTFVRAMSVNSPVSRPRVFVTACAGLMLLPAVANAWSSQASKTEHDIRSLAAMIEVYHSEVGNYPNTNEYWVTLQRAGVWYSPKVGPLNDRWGRPLVYRLPGKHGAFDVYSLGPDGVDNEGRRDDVSGWAGVNDGFHWKATWPAGRFTLRVGVGLSLASCLLLFAYRWQVVLPLAGMGLCISIMIGCNLLMHPGIVRSHNQPLRAVIAATGLTCGGLFVLFVSGLLKDWFTRHGEDFMKTWLIQTILLAASCWVLISLLSLGGDIGRLWHHFGQAFRFDEEFLIFSCFLLFSIALTVHLLAIGWRVSYSRRFLFPELGMLYAIAALVFGNIVRQPLRNPVETWFQIIYPILVVVGFAFCFGRRYLQILKRQGGEPDTSEQCKRAIVQ